jgi:hypothetical protein
VNAVTSSPDGRIVAAAIDDGSVQLWMIDGLIRVSADLVGSSCAAAGQGLPEDVWELVAPAASFRTTC